MGNERLVYVVDDDDSVRRSATFMLRHAGFKVEPVESGVAFLKLAKGAERGCVLRAARRADAGDGRPAGAAADDQGRH